MIKFEPNNYCRKKNYNGLCYLTYNDIDDFTRRLIQDYDDSYLSEIKMIDAEDFALNYLEAKDFDYQFIYTPHEEETILGYTLFESGSIKLFDKDNLTTFLREYDENSIVLDRSLIDGNRKPQLGITAFHECGHLSMHKYVFGVVEGQLDIGLKDSIIVCRESVMDKHNAQFNKTESQWIEWQATTFASTIIMNAPSVEIYMNNFFYDNNIKDRVLVFDDPSNYNLCNHIIPGDISKKYGISKQAARYRLEKIGYYVTKEKYMAEKSQQTIYDYLK